MVLNPMVICAACGSNKTEPLPAGWDGGIHRWCGPCIARIQKETPWWTPQMRFWEIWRHVPLDCSYCRTKFLPEIPSCYVCKDCARKCPSCGDKTGHLTCAACSWLMMEEGINQFPDIHRGSLFGCDPDCKTCRGIGYYGLVAKTVYEGTAKLCECRKNKIAGSLR